MIGIYVITNTINEKRYIGQSKNIEQRIMCHRSSLKHNRHANRHLQAAWNKYGEDAFIFDVLEECEFENLNEREIYYIDLYDTYNNGYNLCEGGNGNPGYKHTQEEIDKMRRIQSPKMVVQLDLKGNYIKTWIGGTSHVSKAFGKGRRNFEACCDLNNKTHKSAYGYLWFYLEDYENDNIDWGYYLDREYNYGMDEVYQLGLDGSIIKRWKNARVAARELGLSSKSISSCCKPYSTQKRCGDYLWMYVDDYSDDINWSDYYKYTVLNRRVCQFDKDKNLINIYKSASDAVRIMNKSSASSITSCCRKKTRSAFGFIWVYEDDYNNNNIDWDFYFTEPKSNKPIVQFNKDGEVIRKFKTITEAAKHFNVAHQTIKNALDGKVKNPKYNFNLQYA